MTKAKKIRARLESRVTGREKVQTDRSVPHDQIERIKTGELPENQSELKKCCDLLEDDLRLLVIECGFPSSYSPPVTDLAS